jgi:hypothetical protein
MPRLGGRNAVTTLECGLIYRRKLKEPLCLAHNIIAFALVLAR